MAKSRYLEPVFICGKHFICQVYDYPDGKRNLTCHDSDTRSGQNDCRDWSKVIVAAMKRIPRGWRRSYGPDGKIICNGSECCIPLVRRR